MNTHNYLTRIKDEHWEDIQRIKSLDNSSANVIINEGIRLVVKEKLQQINDITNRTSFFNYTVSISDNWLSLLLEILVSKTRASTFLTALFISNHHKRGYTRKC